MKAASYCKWIDRRSRRSRRGKQLKKPEWPLKRAFPILHVGVLDVEEGQSEVIVPPSA